MPDSDDEDERGRQLARDGMRRRSNTYEELIRETQRLHGQMRDRRVGINSTNEVMRRLLLPYQTRHLQELQQTEDIYRWHIRDPNFDLTRMRDVYDELQRRAQASLALPAHMIEEKTYQRATRQQQLDDVVQVFKYDEHYSVYSLQTAKALREEGERMHNCVGNGTYTLHLANGNISLYSLRTDEGRVSRALMSVVHHRNNFIGEISGKRNSLVGVRFTPALRAFIESRGFKIDENTRGGFAIGKRV